MKKLLLLMLGLASFTSGFAEKNVTVYYAVPSSVVGDYTVRLNVNRSGDSEQWQVPVVVMTLTDKTYLGYLIYSGTYTDLYGGIGKMQFQLYDGDAYISQQEPVGKWDTTDYDGKLYVHDIGFRTYEYDGNFSYNIQYHMKSPTTWTQTKAYEFMGYANSGWPGVDIKENPWNPGWFDYTVTKPYSYIIFDNGNSGDDNQTKDISIDLTGNEFWYTFDYRGNSVEKPADWLDDYKRTGLTVGNYGTICLPFNATIDGADVYEIASTVGSGASMSAINLNKVTSLEAGKAYIFQATSTTLTATTSGERTFETIDNGMRGNLSSSSIYAPASEGDYSYYVVSENKVKKVTGSEVAVGQYRAYITLTGISSASSRSANFIGFNDESTDIESIQSEKSQNIFYNLQGQRIMNAQKGLYIVNGKIIKK